MTSSFPDLNVWVSLVSPDHPDQASATAWGAAGNSDCIAFWRFIQIDLLRLTATAAVMNGRPLTHRRAWPAYDRRFEEDRVAWITDSAALASSFRGNSARTQPAPKVWAYAYPAAFASANHA
jgi:hypothetical protein